MLHLRSTHIRTTNILVPMSRLELLRLSPLPPQDSVSTNFTTSAIHYLNMHYLGISFDLEPSSGIAAGGTEIDSVVAGITLSITP